MAGAATVEKALDVLFHLHDAGDALGLTEIGRALDLPKSSCHRLLRSLVERDVVEQDFAGRYRPGLALLALGIGAQNREPVIRAARPTLEAEAQNFGETVFLVGARRGSLRVLDKSEGSGFLRAAPSVGDEIPSDVTAAGQLYRAFGRPADWAPGGAAPNPPNPPSPPNPSEAQAEIQTEAAADAGLMEVKARGYALNQDAWISGLSVLGVPIWQAGPGGGEDLVAVLALAASSPRFEALGETVVAERLLLAAEAVGRRLGLAEGASVRRASRAAQSAQGDA